MASRSGLVTPTGRPIAPGGWRRAFVGVLVGVVVGAVAAATQRGHELGERTG